MSDREKRHFSTYEKTPHGDLLGQQSKVFWSNLIKKTRLTTERNVLTLIPVISLCARLITYPTTALFKQEDHIPIVRAFPILMLRFLVPAMLVRMPMKTSIGERA
jgi:hypothetical protein